MLTQTFNTLEAVKVIHKATDLINNPLTPLNLKSDLYHVTEGVLSFVAYSLRIANPSCRPEQVQALNALTKLINQLEKNLEFAKEMAS